MEIVASRRGTRRKTVESGCQVGRTAADLGREPERPLGGGELHERHGPYWVSIGSAAVGKALKMVWRWQGRGGTVWPITAYFPSRRPSRQ